MTTEEKLFKAGIHPDNHKMILDMSIAAAEAYVAKFEAYYDKEYVWEEKLRYREAYIDGVVDMIHAASKNVNLLKRG